jgi:hypothetical protein
MKKKVSASLGGGPAVLKHVSETLPSERSVTTATAARNRTSYAWALLVRAAGLGQKCGLFTR